MLNIFSHQGNASSNHNDTTPQEGLNKKTVKSIVQEMEKLDLSPPCC